MRRITETVIKVMTVAEQIIEAPMETVVVVKYPSRSIYGGTVNEPTHSDALVKTGQNGYRVARRGDGGYLHHNDIQGWVDSFPSNSEFYFV